MSRIQAGKVREQAWLAVLLAGVGGFVDGVGFLVLVHLFTSHMSGNSIAMGVFVGKHDWPAAFHRAFPIPVFVAGALLGAVLTETLTRCNVRSRFAVLFGLEAVLLTLFLTCGGLAIHDGALRTDSAWTFYLLATLLPLAMGMQNTTLRRVGKLTVRTTFITGALTSLAEEAAHYLFWLRDHIRGGQKRRLSLLLRLSPRQPSFNRILVLAGIWGGYVLGAILGAWLEQKWHLLCLVLPVCCLAFLVLLDAVRPIAAPGE